MPVERKADLGLVENVKQDHVVPAVPQAAQGRDDRLGVGQQIAEDHHQAASA